MNVAVEDSNQDVLMPAPRRERESPCEVGGAEVRCGHKKREDCVVIGLIVTMRVGIGEVIEFVTGTVSLKWQHWRRCADSGRSG